MDAEKNSILPKGGGYSKLKSYQKSLIVFDGTVCFTRRFLKQAVVPSIK